MVKDNDSIVVWFSCGAASAVAAWLAVRIWGDRVRIVNNPIKQELDDNRRFLADCEKWLGRKFEEAVNPKYPDGDCEAVWRDRKYMSGVKGAPCTQRLKKEARQLWEDSNPTDWMILGFTSEEQVRSDNFRRTERGNVIPLLIDAGLTKEDCAQILTNHGIELPLSYRLGYNNANCVGCVKATSPTYWNHVRKTHPETFESRAKQSREIGCRLTRYKGKRIFLDELPEDAIGRPMKSIRDVECGIFCEERPKGNSV
jgi:hypothetical protein